MSTAARWIVATVILLLGLAAAIFTVLGGAFSTVACVKVPPDWLYYLLVVVGILVLAAAGLTSAFLVRKAAAIRVAAPAVLGALFMCVGLFAYFVLLGQYC